MSPTSPTIAIVLCLATLALPAARAEDTSAPTGSVESITLQSEVSLAADYVNFDFGALWMMPGRGLVRIDAADGSVMKIPVEGATGRVRALAIGEGAVWIADVGSKAIYKIDPIAKAVALRIPGEIYGVAGSVGDGDVWAVTDNDRVLTRFDARDGRMRVPLPGDSAGVAVAFWSIWVAGNLRNELYRIDPRTEAIVAVTPFHQTPRFIAEPYGSIWVLSWGDGTLQRIDPETGRTTPAVAVAAPGDCTSRIAAGGGYVWTSSRGTPLIQIDPGSRAVRHRFDGAMTFTEIGFGGGSVWLSGGGTTMRIRRPLG
jgi:streptogramin lyase